MRRRDSVVILLDSRKTERQRESGGGVGREKERRANGGCWKDERGSKGGESMYRVYHTVSGGGVFVCLC